MLCGSEHNKSHIPSLNHAGCGYCENLLKTAYSAYINLRYLHLYTNGSSADCGIPDAGSAGSRIYNIVAGYIAERTEFRRIYKHKCRILVAGLYELYLITGVEISDNITIRNNRLRTKCELGVYLNSQNNTCSHLFV